MVRISFPLLVVGLIFLAVHVDAARAGESSELLSASNDQSIKQFQGVRKATTVMIVDKEEKEDGPIKAAATTFFEWIMQLLRFLRLRFFADQISPDEISPAPTAFLPVEPPPPSDTPSLVPSDIPSRMPSDLPSFKPSSMPSLAPSDVPSLVPSDTPSTIPSMMPSDAPSSIPSDMPSVTPSSVPSTMPSKTPSDMPSSVPSDMPSGAPSDIPSLAPSNKPSSVPSDLPSMNPSDYPSMNPSNIPSDTLSTARGIVIPDDPSMTPFTSDYPSMTPFTSDYPSMTPSDYPSMTPSDYPSMIPSDYPSSIPSDYPSINPSDNPSNSRDIVIGDSLPDDFEFCPLLENRDDEDYPQLTIIYRYRLALLPGYSITVVIAEIEKLLHRVLMNGVCDGNTKRTIAISPGPKDLAGSACERQEDRVEAIQEVIGQIRGVTEVQSEEDQETSCYTVAGRATLLISVDGILDTASLYCNALEAIRVYIGSGEIVDLVEGVDAIESPLLGSIIPALCNLIPDNEVGGRKLNAV